MQFARRGIAQCVHRGLIKQIRCHAHLALGVDDQSGRIARQAGTGINHAPHLVRDGEIHQPGQEGKIGWRIRNANGQGEVERGLAIAEFQFRKRNIGAGHGKVDAFGRQPVFHARGIQHEGQIARSADACKFGWTGCIGAVKANFHRRIGNAAINRKAGFHGCGQVIHRFGADEIALGFAGEILQLQGQDAV